MTTLRVLLHVAAHSDYELHSLNFSTAFRLHEEIWQRRPPGFTGSFPAGPSALRLPSLLTIAHSSVYQLLALSSTFGRVPYPLSLLARYVAPGRRVALFFSSLYQRGQLRLAYVATRANTADIFTKALPPGDHQRFSTVLGLVPTLPHLRTP
ncbi:unnamed protein product [Closterium sp. NIES-53]